MEIVSLLFIIEPNLTFLAFGPPVDFFVVAVVEDVDSFLFGVVFGGANGCCGDTEPGFGVTAACDTILRGLPLVAFLSLSLDFDPLKS